MVYGDNKGHRYEKKIVQILEDKKIIPIGKHGAGSGPGTDITFFHNKKEYKVEIKNSVTDPDYGQKRLIPEKIGDEWQWGWAPGVINENITKYYTSIGILDYLNKKKIIPNKYRKLDSELTLKDVKEDQVNFEDRSYEISSEAFEIFYEEKADYVQIGKGLGLFHLKKDIAKIGTSKFEGKFILRFRAKRHTTKNFHCYSFFSVLKCRKVLKKSKINIEELEGQEFPKINP
jgi:hypothetical protein